MNKLPFCILRKQRFATNLPRNDIKQYSRYYTIRTILNVVSIDFARFSTILNIIERYFTDTSKLQEIIIIYSNPRNKPFLGFSFLVLPKIKKEIIKLLLSVFGIIAVFIISQIELYLILVKYH